MRNIKIKSEQKSGKSKGWTIAVVGACILMAGTAGITIRNAVAYNGGSDAQAPPEGQVNVAVANTEIMAGDTLGGNYSFELRDAELIPSDAISQVYDFNGAVMSIDAKPNTVLTDSMIVRPDLDETNNETSRFVSVNYVTLDSGVTEGDFIDIRLRKYGTEEGFVFSDDVVLAKKKVQSVSGKTVTLSLSEQEQMALSVAAVDASSYIDLSDYTDDELLNEIAPFGYDSLTLFYGVSTDYYARRLITECVFENMALEHIENIRFATYEKAEAFVKSKIG